MEAIPEGPAVGNWAAAEDHGEDKCHDSDGVHNDEKTTKTTEPDRDGIYSPDAEVQLQDGDLGDHDQDGVDDREDQEVLSCCQLCSQVPLELAYLQEERDLQRC